VNAIVKVISEGRQRRRRHSEEFKAEVVRACRRRGVSIAAVALANGLNANLVRRWVDAAERADNRGVVATREPVVARREVSPTFVPLQMSAPTSPAEIRIELKRGPLAVKVSWPASAAAECTGWLRELLR